VPPLRTPALSASARYGQLDVISRSCQPAPSILGDFGRVGSAFGSFCLYDAIRFEFRVSLEFWVHVMGHFAHTTYTDSPIRLAPRPTVNPTQNVDRISILDRAGFGGCRSTPGESPGMTAVGFKLCCQFQLVPLHQGAREGQGEGREGGCQGGCQGGGEEIQGGHEKKVEGSDSGVRGA